MSKDLLSFTKQISGIDLIDYVVNYIDANMIAYKYLSNIDHDIKFTREGSNMIYDIGLLSNDEIERIKEFPISQDLCVYNKLYRVSVDIPDKDRFIINIIEL